MLWAVLLFCICIARLGNSLDSGNLLLIGHRIPLALFSKQLIWLAKKRALATYLCYYPFVGYLWWVMNDYPTRVYVFIASYRSGHQNDIYS